MRGVWERAGTTLGLMYATLPCISLIMGESPAYNSIWKSRESTSKCDALGAKPNLLDKLEPHWCTKKKLKMRGYSSNVHRHSPSPRELSYFISIHWTQFHHFEGYVAEEVFPSFHNNPPKSTSKRKWHFCHNASLFSILSITGFHTAWSLLEAPKGNQRWVVSRAPICNWALVLDFQYCSLHPPEWSHFLCLILRPDSDTAGTL